jgi:hypothetical protein
MPRRRPRCTLGAGVPTLRAAPARRRGLQPGGARRRATGAGQAAQEGQHLIHHRDKVHPFPPDIVPGLRASLRLHHSIDERQRAEGSSHRERHVEGGCHGGGRSGALPGEVRGATAACSPPSRTTARCVSLPLEPCALLARGNPGPLIPPVPRHPAAPRCDARPWITVLPRRVPPMRTCPALGSCVFSPEGYSGVGGAGCRAARTSAGSCPGHGRQNAVRRGRTQERQGPFTGLCGALRCPPCGPSLHTGQSHDPGRPSS